MRTEAPDIRPDPAKLKELALYIAKESESDPSFGKTKLTKLLFYCDFFAYAALGKPIAGAKYEVWEQGPVLSRFYDFLDSLTQPHADGEEPEAAFQTRDHFGYQQHRIVALREPELSGFTGQEIALVNQVIKLFKDKNAAEMSRVSHQHHAWKSFRDGEEIPYTSIFLTSRKLTQREKDYALELVPTPLNKCA